ncbi:MAG: hypothetical protein EOP49_10680, partial [Sphingobacteriales bacterium]
MHHLLLISCFIEALLFTYLINVAGPHATPAILLFTSLCIAIVFLRVQANGAVKSSISSQRPLAIRFARLFVFACLTVLLVFKNASIIEQHPVSINDPSHSDIIPTLLQQVAHLTKGENPYSPITFPNHPGYIISPTYPPFTWIPYTIAWAAGADFRWLAVLAYWIAALFLFIKSFRSEASFGSYAFNILAPSWALIIWCMVAFS